MGKTPSQDLFLLIKSLNKNEKGYIKKTAFRHTDGETNFLRLFDAIDSQKIYDDQKLRQSEKYVRQLPRLKNYLYEKILSSLETYHAAKNKDIQIRQLLNRVHVLFDKGFYDQCRRILFRAKEIADKQERFSLLLEILEWERVLTIEKLMVANIQEIGIQEKNVLDKLQNLAFYKSAYDRVSQLYTKTIYIRSESEKQEFKKIVGTKEFKNENNASSITSQILLYKTIGKYLSALDDRKNYLHYARKAVAFMEAHPGYTDEHLLQYIKVLNNLIVTLGENGKHEEWKAAIKKLRAIPRTYPSANNEKMHSIIFMRAVIREFYYYQNQGDYYTAHKMVSKIQEGLEKYYHLISVTHRMLFYYAISYSYFIMGDLKKALEWSNSIINERLTLETQAFHHFARILNLIIHFELGNNDLLEYLVRSTKRFFAREQKLFKLENAVIQFIEKYIADTPDEKMTLQWLKSFREKISKMNDPLEYNILEYFDFLSWTESKIENKKFADVLSRKSKDRTAIA